MTTEELNLLSREYIIRHGCCQNSDNQIRQLEDLGIKVYKTPPEPYKKGWEYLYPIYELYDNGNIAYYKFMDKGIDNGLWITFFKSGKVKSYCIMISGKPCGKSYEWYESGALKNETDYYKNDDDCVIEEYNESENIRIEKIGVLHLLTKEYVMEHGSRWDYNDDGICWSGEWGDQIYTKPMEEGGVPFSGLIYGLHKNGNLSYYRFVENGAGQGFSVKFYPNGQIQHYIIQRKGTPVGKFYYWYENGILKEENDYYDNYVISTSVSYDENGNIIKRYDKSYDRK
ncbi:MAG: hypothetical protein NC253_04500 [Ruminococcus sp.]|nr:hypothetical protein [Ruminococcus sp.]MCM1381232.1 hypothetical protein [Muribaculaceae bacterium]MCM1479472.1 hypothetical protein [Muribaculaceae bacterium]